MIDEKPPGDIDEKPLGDRLHAGMKKAIADIEEAADSSGLPVGDFFTEFDDNNWGMAVVGMAKFLAATTETVTRKEAAGIFHRYEALQEQHDRIAAMQEADWRASAAKEAMGGTGVRTHIGTALVEAMEAYDAGRLELAKHKGKEAMEALMEQSQQLGFAGEPTDRARAVIAALDEGRLGDAFEYLTVFMVFAGTALGQAED